MKPPSQPLELERAHYAATKLRGLLLPALSEVVIAGSVRRCKAQVKDIEIVGLLREDLSIPAAEHAISQLVHQGIDRYWIFDDANRKDGRRYKRLLILVGEQEIGVDLFLADAANFGAILAIRTGDAEFTRLMVTRGSNGLMPAHLCQKDGYLQSEQGVIPCRTEGDYFAALGLPVIEPSARCLQTAQAIIQQRRATCR